MKCTCQDWKENIDKVNAPLMLQFARNPTTTKGYEGKKFIFCPWCSHLLIDDGNAEIEGDPIGI